jgi:ribosomal-protein-alanine N-acetyltransferase
MYACICETGRGFFEGGRALSDQACISSDPPPPCHSWIASLRPAYEAGKTLTWAVVLREEGGLVGAITLHPNARNDNVELGYWIGRPYWGRGYATEAAREVVCYGFERLGLHCIHAEHLGSNPASGRVMQKIGMSYEGTRPEQHKKWGAYEDRVDYGLLARDWRDLHRR